MKKIFPFTLALFLGLLLLNPSSASAQVGPINPIEPPEFISAHDKFTCKWYDDLIEYTTTYYGETPEYEEILKQLRSLRFSAYCAENPNAFSGTSMAQPHVSGGR